MHICVRNKKKLFLGLTGAIFLFSVVGAQLFPEKVFAQLGPAPLQADPEFLNADAGISTPVPTLVAGTPVFDAAVVSQQASIQVTEKVERTILKSITASVLSAAVQGASYYAKKVAYDTARYVAYGGKGQGALVFRDGWGAYFANTAKDAAAEAIVTLGRDLGLDACQFPDINLQLYLQIGIRQQDAPTIDCSWNDLTKNWSDGAKGFAKKFENLDDGDVILNQFSKAIQPMSTDFGIGIGALLTVDRIKVQKEKAATAERTTNKGFKDLSDFISGNIKTPGDVIAEETKTQLSESNQQHLNWSQLGSVYASGAIEIIPQTASMFLNTLGATLLQRLFSQGITSGGEDSGLAYDYGFDAGVQNSADAAKNAYNFLFARVPTQPIDYNNIAEFAACPDNPGINNCVMDSGLQEAISRSNIDTPITIAEAIKQGLLNPNWPLISPRRLQENQNIKGCVAEKYCYSNIQKLRKARILPLGFEIAALRSDPDKPWTLGEVVARFDECDRPDPNNPSVVVPNPEYPFCHLINPNWVIKAPQARCDIKSFGDALIDPSVSTRREECVDVSTCLAKDNTGACAQFGYCTKESNTWRMGADFCPAEYNTCTTYTNLDSKKIVSYLAKTVDYGECTADNVGCRAYSIEESFGSANPWKNSASVNSQLTQTGRSQVVFFNKKIQNVSSVCSAENNGCSAFYGAQRFNNGQYFDTNTTTLAIEFAIDKSIDPIHLKKAPDYLGCYDTDRAANSPSIQWPSTIFEATFITNTLTDQQKTSCDTFASACVPEEVGCEAFTPADGGPVIPGKIGDKNFCAQECLGYETFKQEPAELDTAKFPVYFIPTQATSCPSTANGCSEFTNIDTQTRGGEGLEYYTDLKYCEKPAADESNIKTFYSWEGSLTNGYTLLTHRLKPVTQNESNGQYTEGSPAYILTTPEAIATFHAKCNQVNYNLLLQNPDHPDVADIDCRALFDKAGSTYYRLFTKTVTVDATCHPLRKTEPVFEPEPRFPEKRTCENQKMRWNGPNDNQGVCERCINGGKFENGFCIYQTISRPNESTSCAPQYNGCRGYSGNAVGNIEEIFLNDFEPGSESPEAFAEAMQGWASPDPQSPLQVVGESIFRGQHSLQLKGAGARKEFLPGNIEKDGWYQLSFLAKSSGPDTNLVISLNEDGVAQGYFSGFQNSLRIGGEWQQYNLGPIKFTGNASNTVQLVIFHTGGGLSGPYFIDQVRVRHLDDYSYYLKDSWKAKNAGLNVPTTCDSAPEDTLPGEALGCRQYNDSTNVPRYATGFQNLCREKAIGCMPVWDTFNTVSDSGAEQAQAFNVKCNGGQNSTCKAMYQQEELGNCFIPQGATACTIPHIILPVGMKTFAELQINNIILVDSSIFVPADTADNAPIFLATGEKQKYACDSAALGCQKVGQEQRHLPTSTASAFSFTEMFVKNDPASYKDTLCRKDLVGCSQYSTQNKNTYFKDPEITGNSLCTYKSQSEGISSQYGWYLSGVGKCATAALVVGDQLCRSDTDCPRDNRCVQIGEVACSENNLRVGGFYDIWSNKSQQYQGNVGVCPAEQNSCTELIDRQDTSNSNPEGKPYYVLYNQKIEEKKKECTQVSLSEGCVLFDKTDEPNKVYDSAVTYHNSEIKPGQPFGPVNPVRSGDTGFLTADTNLLMKVNRDRECSEWLACKSYASAVSYEGGSRHESQICSQLAACDKVGIGGTCANWVDPRTVRGNAALNRLTYDQYITRPVSWYSTEMSGYSLYNKYQIGDMIYLKFNFPGEDLQALMSKEINQTYIARQLRQNIFDILKVNEFDCKPNAAGEDTDWETCGFGDNQVNGGRCYDNRCIYPIDGSFPSTIDVRAQNLSDVQKAPLLKQLINFLEPNSCKGTPEVDSPYSDKILKVGVGQQKLINPGIPGERTNTSFKLEGFSNANVCQKGECACAYQKLQYGANIVDYWPLFGLETGTVIPEGVCVGGGNRESLPCTQSADCIDANGTVTTEDDDFGVCNLRTNAETRIGLEGYCLEEDRSRPIFYNGQNSFACLTWLPVNISASAVDIYNTDISAGYNLKDDAALGGGEVMCASSTAVGAGVYDPAVMIIPAGQEQKDRLSAYYNNYFHGNGLPNMNGYQVARSGDPFDYNANYTLNVSPHLTFSGNTEGHYQNYSCGDDFRNGIDGVENVGGGNPGNQNQQQARQVPSIYSPYITAVCSGDDVFEPLLATAMYSWLHRQDIPNATLLRMEYGLGPGGWANWGNDYDIEPESEQHTARRIFSFAPMNLGVDSTQGAAENAGEKIKEFGTIMHMPRTFAESLSESDTWLKQSDLVNPPENMDEDRGAKVHTGGYGVIGESGARGGRLYRSNFERYMRENDLSKVYFLGMSYPGGVEGQGPALMQKDYVIDFDRLRTPGLNPADATLLLDTLPANKQFVRESKNRDTVLWTYKLDNVSQSNFDFNDYSHFHQSNRVEDLITGLTGERNRIQTRYVAVWSDWLKAENTQTPNFLEQHVPIDQAEGIPGIIREQVTPANSNSDPFTAPCVSEHNNWLAIGMDFNKDGEFLGYIARWCNAFENGVNDAGAQFAVAASLHDRCTTFNQVYQDDGIHPLSGTTNKAKTNITWFGAKASSDSSKPRTLFGSPWSSISIDTPSRPYASLQLSEQDLANHGKLRNYVFRTKWQGLPYMCSAEWLGGSSIDTTKMCEAMGIIPQIDRGFINGMNRISNPQLNQADPDDVPEVLEANADGVAVQVPPANGFDPDAGLKKLHGLFAKVFSITTLDTIDYSRGEGLTIESDLIQNLGVDTSGSDAKPPKIFSLNPFRCEDRNNCSAAEQGNITISNQNGTRLDYNGDGIPDEPDADQNGVTDPIIVPGGVYTAEAKFFAFADDDHMPLRRVMVDWDEEGLPPTNADKRGLYKNRKPICGTSNQGGAADVGLCAKIRAGNGINVPPTFIPTGLTCSGDNLCPINTICIPHSGSYGSAKVCGSTNAANDHIYSAQMCSLDRDCRDLPNTPKCLDINQLLPQGDLISGAMGPSYKSMRFGNTPRACTTDYFTFVHQYSCGPSNIGTKNAVRVQDLNTAANPYQDSSFTQAIEDQLKNKFGLRDTDYVCVFKPRVQVEDNWDWCNGECTTDYTGINPTAGAATRKACYNNQATDNPVFPSHQCDTDPVVPGINPWSDYNGSIIVIPDIDR